MSYEKVSKQLPVDERVLKILNKFDAFNERGEINPELLRMFVKLVFNSKDPKEFKKWQKAIKGSEIFTDSQKSILLGMLAGKWAMNTGDFDSMFNEEYGGYGGTFDKTPKGCKLSQCQGWFTNNRRTAWKESENSGKAFRRSISHGATFTGSLNRGEAFAESEILGSAFNGSYNYGNAFAKTPIYGSAFAGSANYGNAFAESRILGSAFNGSVNEGNAFAKTLIYGSAFTGSLNRGEAFAKSQIFGNAFAGSANYGNAFAGTKRKSIDTFKGSVERDEASSNIFRALNA